MRASLDELCVVCVECVDENSHTATANDFHLNFKKLNLFSVYLFLDASAKIKQTIKDANEIAIIGCQVYLFDSAPQDSMGVCSYLFYSNI